MKKNLILVFLFGYTLCNAQSNIVVSGGQSSGSAGSITYTVGQVDFISTTSSEGTLTFGVQQPYEIILLETVNFESNINLMLYPNPTYQNINLTISDYANQKMSYLLFDITGKVLMENKITQQETIISLENYSSSIYIIKVIGTDKNSSKSYKIIKK